MSISLSLHGVQSLEIREAVIAPDAGFQRTITSRVLLVCYIDAHGEIRLQEIGLYAEQGSEFAREIEASIAARKRESELDWQDIREEIAESNGEQAA